MKKISIAAGLTLPLDAVTQTFGILAKRRAGKSFTARRFVEQLFHADQQVVIVDPKGDWWGILSSADGKAPGLPIIILGGERGHAELQAQAGEVVAKLVVEERVSLLLDLSLFRKHEVATFMTGFLETLYRLKAREAYRTPVMLVIDEADAIAPQKPQKGEERMLGAADDIVRRGGQRGIGCTLVSQRSAVINKNVLTQVQVLVALRTIAPQDLAALDAWVDVHGTEEERKTLMASLPSLPTGDAWFWSPGWPTVDGIFQRVHVLPIETFDSGATPGQEKRVEPKRMADVDLDALRRQMADAIEAKKANDPRLLKARIAELEAELRKKATPAPAPPVRVEVPVIDGRHIGALEIAAQDATNAADALRAQASVIQAAIAAAKALNGGAHAREHVAPSRTNTTATEPGAGRNAPLSAPKSLERDRRPAPLTKNAELDPNGLSMGEQRTLDTIRTLVERSLPLTIDAIARWQKIHPNGGRFRQGIARLRAAGLIDANGYALTDAGKAASRRWDGNGGLGELLAACEPGARTVMDVVLKHASEGRPPLSIEACALTLGVHPNGGRFRQNIARLRQMGVIPASGHLAPVEGAYR